MKDCDNCMTSYDDEEYTVTVGGDGALNDFCCWSCLLEYGDTTIDDLYQSRAGAIAAMREFEERLARVFTQGQANA